MRVEDQQTEKGSRVSRFLRRALLVVGGAVAAAVITSAPAWADVIDDSVATTTTAIGSVADTTNVHELPSRVLGIEPDLVPTPALPISLDTGFTLLHEFATELPVVLPSAEPRHGDATAPSTSHTDLASSSRVGQPAVSTSVIRFDSEPTPPSSTTSDVIASEGSSTLPLSSITNGLGSDSSTVVPRRGELNGTCHAMRTTEAGQLACRSWTSVVRVMSVQVGKQPGRTPD